MLFYIKNYKNQVRYIIGIDHSLNCTGVCVWDTVSNNNVYYMISTKETRKMKQFSNSHIHIITYSKSDTKKLSYSEKECKKFDNIYIICKNIQTILQKYQDCCVLMEGVSYGSVGSAALVDLSFLNSALRMVFKSMNIPMTIVSPTSVKKFACGNGQAEKDIMIDAWKRMDNNISGIKDIKIDDLADSYFLAHYSE